MLDVLKKRLLLQPSKAQDILAHCKGLYRAPCGDVVIQNGDREMFYRVWVARQHLYKEDGQAKDQACRVRIRRNLTTQQLAISNSMWQKLVDLRKVNHQRRCDYISMKYYEAGTGTVISAPSAA